MAAAVPINRRKNKRILLPFLGVPDGRRLDFFPFFGVDLLLWDLGTLKNRCALLRPLMNHPANS